MNDAENTTGSFIFTTPLKTPAASRDEDDDDGGLRELCSVCLSPLPQRHCFDIPPGKEIVSTNCQHHFHKRCLHQVKEHCQLDGNVCPQCPMCRCNLTPLQKLKPTIVDFTQSMTLESLRNTIVQSAARGRNAVRQAMLQRNYSAMLQETDSVNTMVFVQ